MEGEAAGNVSWMIRRSLVLALALLAVAVPGACSDDDDTPLAPNTGRDLETPTSKVTPPSPPDQ